MANFHGHQIPQAGQNLMAKLFATGRPLVYTSVKVGDGALNGRLVSGLTGLIGLKKSFPIAATPIRSGDGRWNVTAIFNNADIDADFWWREWGIFAEDPDTGQEVLMAYANAGDTADYIHAWTGSDDSSYVEEQITCTCLVSSNLEVTALIDPSQLYVLLEVYQAHLKEFIAHRDDKNNPHGVTIAQIGAAAASHIHTAADVGALPANTAYVPPTRKVAGKALSADVTLSKADVGLGSVDNTADSAKSVKYATSAGSTSGNAGSATKLQTARTIDGVSFNGTAAITHYGSCSTAAATAAKVVACAGFALVTGARIVVKFTVTNTAANPTLNVNSTGAKAIWYRGAAIAAGYLSANRTIEFVYNGAQYEVIGDFDTNTTYTAAAAAPKAPGTAAVGSSAKYAREDHVHPLPTATTSRTDYTTAGLRNIRAGTADLTAGTSALNNGEIYLVYE